VWSTSVLLLAGCASAAPVSSADPTSSREQRASEPVNPMASGDRASVAAPLTAGASLPIAAAPARPPRPAQDSYPAGLNSLGPSEAEDLAKHCKRFADAVAMEARKAAGKAPAGTRVVDLTLSAIERLRTAASAGTDGRCATLMRRDVEAYAARSIETGAIVMLRIALRNLSERWSTEKHLCTSAGPVPRDVELLRRPRSRAELGPEVEQLACVQPTFAEMPTRWSLEVRTDAAKKTWEIIARGFPVQGGPVAELFIAGEIGPEGIPLEADVMRR
jgi:hypothetical protein